MNRNHAIKWFDDWIVLIEPDESLDIGSEIKSHKLIMRVLEIVQKSTTPEGVLVRFKAEPIGYGEHLEINQSK